MTNSQQQSEPQNQQSSMQTKTPNPIQETLNKLKSGEMKFIC